MLDGTYLSRNFATLGPMIRQPPCDLRSCAWLLHPNIKNQGKGMSEVNRFGDEERRLMHLVPAPAVSCLFAFTIRLLIISHFTSLLFSLFSPVHLFFSSCWYQFSISVFLLRSNELLFNNSLLLDDRRMNVWAHKINNS